MEQECRADLPSIGAPITELPRLAGQMTHEGLGDLAEIIREQVLPEVPDA